MSTSLNGYTLSDLILHHDCPMCDGGKLIARSSDFGATMDCNKCKSVVDFNLRICGAVIHDVTTPDLPRTFQLEEDDQWP